MNHQWGAPKIKSNQLTSVLRGLSIGKLLAYFVIKLLRSVARSVEEFSGIEGFYQFHLLGKIHGVQMKSVGDRYVVSHNGIQSQLRSGTSDMSVYVQVFFWEDYNRVVALMAENHMPIKTMIDAGANIGLTTQLFCNAFPGLEVVAVEPDPENYALLRQNAGSLNGSKVKCLHAGVSSGTGWLIPAEKKRKGEEWSRIFTYSSSKDADDAIPAFSIEEMMQQEGWDFVDFLKMDIEGAEHPIFRSIGDQGSFLDRIGIIALEIHGNTQDRNFVMEKLRRHSFILIQSREITIGIKRDWLR